MIVPVLNGASLIRGCLGALDAQTLDPSAYEIVVVDDGSTDDTTSSVQRFANGARASVSVLRREVNRGPAAARNAGIERARASVIAFTDADCEPDPDWLSRALDVLRSHPEAAAVEGSVLPKGETGTLTHQMRNATGGQYMTANMVFRREALEKAGGFDERFRRAYLEDTDVAFTILESGGTIAWAPEMIVRHLVLPEGRRKFWRDARKHFYNPLVYAKHPRTYVERLRPLRPAFPKLYWAFMASTVAVVAGALLAVFAHPAFAVLLLAAVPMARGWWRIAYVHRARDPISFLQAGAYPFVQTFWVLAGAVRFGAFSPKL